MSAPVSRPAEIPAAVVYCHACGREILRRTDFVACAARLWPPTVLPPSSKLPIFILRILLLRILLLRVVMSLNPAADFQRAELYREVAPSEDRQVAHLFAQEPAPQAQVNEQPFIRLRTLPRNPHRPRMIFCRPRRPPIRRPRRPGPRPLRARAGFAALSPLHRDRRGGCSCPGLRRMAQRANLVAKFASGRAGCARGEDAAGYATVSAEGGYTGTVPDQTSDRTSELASPAAPHTAVPSNNQVLHDKLIRCALIRCPMRQARLQPRGDPSGCRSYGHDRRAEPAGRTSFGKRRRGTRPGATLSEWSRGSGAQQRRGSEVAVEGHRQT